MNEYKMVAYFNDKTVTQTRFADDEREAQNDFIRTLQANNGYRNDTFDNLIKITYEQIK